MPLPIATLPVARDSSVVLSIATLTLNTCCYPFCTISGEISTTQPLSVPHSV
jgi:hypothetical protein